MDLFEIKKTQYDNLSNLLTYPFSNRLLMFKTALALEDSTENRIIQQPYSYTGLPIATHVVPSLFSIVMFTTMHMAAYCNPPTDMLKWIMCIFYTSTLGFTRIIQARSHFLSTHASASW